ncbi:MAG: V-type ATPase subunit [Smithella sp.]
MRNYADKVNLHARIHALKGRLLSPGDYASMIRAQQANSLKLSTASDLITAKESIFREQIAPAIGFAEAYGQYAPLFLAYLRQFEVHNFKILLAKAAELESEELWYDISPFAILEKDLLAKKLSPAEIRTIIAGTYLDEDFKDTSSYRQMEIHADICMARNLYQSAQFLSGEAKKDFYNLMQRRIAVLTVIWSYRLKEYYHFSEEKIRFYLQRFHSLFDGYAKFHFRIIEKAQNRQLEQLHKEGGGEPSITDIERYLEQNYFAWVSSMFHRDFHSIYSVLGYLWLLYYQIRNLFRIIDGRRFGFSADAILDKLTLEA